MSRVRIGSMGSWATRQRNHEDTKTRRGPLAVSSSWLRGFVVASVLRSRTFDDEMTSGYRGLTACAQAVDKLRRVLGPLALVPRIVDHHHRRAIARAKALDLDQREHPVLVGLTGLEAERLAERFGHPRGAVQCARQRAAHLQDEPADGPPIEHRVERHDVFHVGAGDAEQIRDIANRVGRDVALLLLREIERREDRGSPTIRWIAGDDLVEAPAMLLCVDERRPFVLELARRPVKGRVVRHSGMKTHRSTSPITTSIDPITAITSAISPPTISLSSAWQAGSDGARACRRHARLVRAATTEKPCSPRGPSTATYASPAGTVKPCEYTRKC